MKREITVSRNVVGMGKFQPDLCLIALRFHRIQNVVPTFKFSAYYTYITVQVTDNVEYDQNLVLRNSVRGPSSLIDSGLIKFQAQVLDTTPVYI